MTVSDLLDVCPELTSAEISESLKAFAEEERLPESDVAVLARIEFRGEQPHTTEGWRFLYNAIKYSATGDL